MTQSTPRVSIGFPVFNVATSVRKSLDALLGQTFADFEILVSDNASTDDTVKICEEIAARDPRVRVFRHEENRGPFWNFRYVLEPALGAYFMWAAGDDSWHPRFIERCVDTLDRRPDVGVVFPRAEIRSLRIPLVRRDDLPYLDFIDSDDVFERVRRYIEIPASTHKANAIYGLWRTELTRRTVAAVGPVEPHIAYLGLDIAMMTFVLTQTKMVQLPEVMFYKTSKWFPSGSRADRIMGRVVSKVRPAKLDRAAMFRTHIELVRRLLRDSGVYGPRYEQVLEAKLQSMIAES